jgi:hypothetical protein
MRTSTLAAGAALLISTTYGASAAVWGFGDSNLDTGWFTTAPYSGHISFDIYLQRASAYGIGKQTNNPGPMSIEVLAGLLKASALPGNQPGGTVFATSGAKNFDANTPANGGFPNAVPTATQIATFLATHTIGASDVFVIDSGANDVSYALTLNPTDQRSYLQQNALHFAKLIGGLQLKGAAHLIIVNQPESFGTTDLQAARHLYNTTLKSGLDTLGVTYAWGNRDRVRQDIVDDTQLHQSVKFNMQYVGNGATVIACPQPNGFTGSWAILCSAKSPATQPTPFAQQTLFADESHWASNGQKVLASYYVCLVAKYWPSLIPPPVPLLPPPQPPYPCGAFSEFAPPPL